MALPPARAAAPAPADMMPPEAMPPGMDGMEPPMEDDMAEGPVVVATILRNADGTYTVQEGDTGEMEPGEMGEMGDEEMGGMPPGGGMGMPGEGMMPGGQAFDYENRGELLNRINEILEAGAGEGTGMKQQAFEAGFEGATKGE